jgi:hypothetical protein
VVKAHPTRYRIKGEEAKKRASIGGVSFVSGDWFRVSKKGGLKKGFRVLKKNLQNWRVQLRERRLI